MACKAAKPIKMTNLIQTAKVGVAGGFINQLYGNNNSEPKVDVYCTFCHYTDRTVGIVREWNKETLEVVIESCNTSYAGEPGTGYQGHQDWNHTPSGHLSKYKYIKTGWYKVGTEFVFTKKFRESIPSDYIGIWLRNNNPELADKIYGDHIMPCNYVEGVTRPKTTHSKVSVLFGVCDYYYDWSF